MTETAVGERREVDLVDVPPASAKPSASRARVISVVLDAGLALVPAATTVFFAARAGGYFPGSIGLVAAELLVLLAVVITTIRPAAARLRAPLVVAALALAGLAGWTILSGTWSDSPARALAEFNRVLLYLGAFALFGLVGYSRRRIRWMLYAFSVAIVGICAVALVSRTAPDVILHVPPVEPERLSYPLGYWNALGLLGALGMICCAHLTCSLRDRWPIRVAAAGAFPILAATLYYTLSRGGFAVAIGGILVYVLVGRPRGLVGGAIGVAPSTALALYVVDSSGALTGPHPTSADILSVGHRVAVTLAGCVVAAIVLRALALPSDVWLQRLTLSRGRRKGLLGAAAAVLFIGVIGGGAAVGVPELLGEKVEEFQADGAAAKPATTGLGRLASGSDNGRRKHWRISLDAYRADPWRGSGAGTYALVSWQNRPNFSTVQDAHSLYVEVLGELGVPGLVLVGAALLLILGAFAARARGPDRPLFAALFAAGIAWAAHAGFEWDWEMPVVTLWLFAFGGAALARTVPEEPAGRAGVSIAVRAAGALACLALAVLPLRMAVSQSRLDDSLSAYRNGDCDTARARAEASLDAVRKRPSPYQVIGTCDLIQRKPASALRAMRRATELDPRNWELRYDLAVAEAMNGRDPRGTLRTALELSPYAKLVWEARERFAGGRAATWPRVAGEATLPEPGPPVP